MERQSYCFADTSQRQMRRKAIGFSWEDRISARHEQAFHKFFFIFVLLISVRRFRLANRFFGMSFSPLRLYAKKLTTVAKNLGRHLSARWYLNRGFYCHKRRKWADASRFLHVVLDNHHDWAVRHPALFARLGQACQELKDWGNARRYTRTALDLAGELAPAEWHVQLGCLLLQTKKYEEAARHFDAAIAISHPVPASLKAWLGMAHIKMNHFEQAIPPLIQACSDPEAPPRAEWVVALSRAFSGVEDVGAAVSCLERHAASFPRNVDYHLHLALALRRQDRLEECAALLLRLVEGTHKRHDRHRVFAALGRVYAEEGTLDGACKARHYYVKALEVVPGHAGTLLALGNQEMKLRDFASAKQRFERLVQLDHASPIYWGRLAAVKSGLKQHEDAISDYLKAVANASTDGEKSSFLRKIAAIHESCGNWREAHAYWRDAISLEGRDLPLLARALRAEFMSGKEAEAIEGATGVIQEARNTPVLAKVVSALRNDRFLAALAIPLAAAVKSTVDNLFEVVKDPAPAFFWLEAAHLNNYVRWVLIDPLWRDPATRVLARLLTAVYEGRQNPNLHKAVHNDIVMSYFPVLDDVDRDLCLRCVPTTLLKGWFDRDRSSAVAFLRDRFRRRFDDFTPRTWLTVAEESHGAGERVLCREIIERLAADRDKCVAGADRQFFDDVRWFADGLAYGTTAFAQSGAVNVGVFSYKNLSRANTSRDTDDYLSSLLLLSQLGRLANVEFDGESGFPSVLQRIRDRLPSERRLQEPAGSLNLLDLRRDITSHHVHAERVWLFVTGTFGRQPCIAGEYDFPLRENVRPIFIGFGLARYEVLTVEQAQYIKRFEPVGCMDWRTVRALREWGIDAFLSGPLELLSEDLVAGSGYDRIHRSMMFGPAATSLADIDYFTPDNFRVLYDDTRVNLLNVLDIVENIRRYDCVITAKPSIAMVAQVLGKSVDFDCGKCPSPRFFKGFRDSDLNRMRDRLSSKITGIAGWLATGTSESDIEVRWRDMCRDDLADAAEYCASRPRLPAPSFDATALAHGIRGDAFDIRPEFASREHCVHIALATDRRLAKYLPIVMRSILSNTRRPVFFHLLLRGLGAEYFKTLEMEFVASGIRCYSMDSADYGDGLNLLPHITVSTMDRLMLPLLLTEVKKFAYIDIDTVVLGDIAELFEEDLGGAALAAVKKTESRRLGDHLWDLAAAETLCGDMELFHNWLHCTGGLNHPYVNAGLYVLDMSRLDRSELVVTAASLIGNFHLHDEDVLNICFRGSTHFLPGNWNVTAVHEDVAGAKMLHWIGAHKPWMSLDGRRRGDWARYEFPPET